VNGSYKPTALNPNYSFNYGLAVVCGKYFWPFLHRSFGQKSQHLFITTLASFSSQKDLDFLNKIFRIFYIKK
jgi:hypothetical protein